MVPVTMYPILGTELETAEQQQPERSTSLVDVPDDVRREVESHVKRGLNPTCRELGMGRETILSILAGRKIRLGTLLVLQQRLAESRQRRDAAYAEARERRLAELREREG